MIKKTTKKSQPKPAHLAPRQRLFVAEYLIDRNATQAAIRTGYSKRTATVQGSRLLSKANVRAAIEAGEKAIADRNQISADRVVQELALLGFANLADYMKLTPTGEPYVDFSELTRDQAAALQEVTVEDFVDRRGKEARDVRRIKFKLADKRAALVDLGRHLGMFKERIELSGKNGGPVQTITAEMSAEEAAKIYRQRMCG